MPVFASHAYQSDEVRAAYLSFCLVRKEFAAAFMGWQATHPDLDDVDEEIAGTGSLLRQLVRLVRAGGVL
jgi:hypothetical protein